jgi:hypothetical protein
MKKSLTLALAMALGITASAYAANPFSDVPAGHWAYGSIAKLAAAGVIDGYPDGTFQGDKLMTRYEMAQIVAKAMAKGANVDRLASEFADELDALGVRVAKLEKKSDNVRITGQVRYSYADVNAHASPDDGYAEGHAYDHNLRSRIWFTGTVNDNWNYISMLENKHSFSNDIGVGGHTSVQDEAGEGTAFQRAYLQGRLGGTRITAGRQDFTLVDGNLYDTRMDGIRAEYGSKVKVGAYYGRPTDEDSWFDYDKFWGAYVQGDIGKLSLSAGYDKFTNSVDNGTNFNGGIAGDDAIWNLGAKYDFGKASLGAIFMKTNINADGPDYSTGNTDKALIITGTLLGAEAAKPGSWGMWAKYYNQGYGTIIAHTMNGMYSNNGFQGWGLGLNYTLAKNMVAGLEYYDLDAKGMATHSYKTLYGELMITY